LFARSWLGWLLERLGDFGLVLFCLLVSSILSRFLSVLLSVLGSDATSVKALAYHADDDTRTGFLRASASIDISLLA